MGAPVNKTLETEQERQQLLDEMEADYGAGWREQFKPGSFGCHELLDRTSWLGDTLEAYVLSHPACIQNPQWYALANQAVTALRELYQRIGAEHMEPTSDASSLPRT